MSSTRKRTQKAGSEPKSGSSDKDQRDQNQQKSTTRPKKSRWIRCGPVKYLFIFVAGVFLLNYASLKRESTALRPKGDLYDIGWGQKMFVRCSGTGQPVVVLDSAVGDTSDAWTLVETLISKYTKVCVYDRAGLGFSDFPKKNVSEYAQDFSESAKQRDRTKPGTVERMADDLYRLMSLALEPPQPLFLVGVDLSTLVARFYTQLFDRDVAGLVLIDPLVETLFDGNSSWMHHWYDEVVPQVSSLYLSAMIGLNRLSLIVGLTKPVADQEVLRVVPEGYVDRKKYLMCQPSHLSSVLDELFFTNESMNQVKTLFKIKPFPAHVAVTVASFSTQPPNIPPTLAKQWTESHRFLSEVIHPGSKSVVIRGSSHNALLLHPQAVSSTIISAVQAWRQGKM